MWKYHGLGRHLGFKYIFLLLLIELIPHRNIFYGTFFVRPFHTRRCFHCVCMALFNLTKIKMWNIWWHWDLTAFSRCPHGNQGDAKEFPRRLIWRLFALVMIFFCVLCTSTALLRRLHGAHTYPENPIIFLQSEYIRCFSRPNICTVQWPLGICLRSRLYMNQL
jgi:hypothetical protein